MNEPRVYGGGAALARTSERVGRIGEKAAGEGTARLWGREREESAGSMSPSESVSDDEEAGDSSGVVEGEEEAEDEVDQKKRGG